jgi:hypothetical protein
MNCQYQEQTTIEHPGCRGRVAGFPHCHRHHGRHICTQCANDGNPAQDLSLPPATAYDLHRRSIEGDLP